MGAGDRKRVLLADRNSNSMFYRLALSRFENFMVNLGSREALMMAEPVRLL
jgi:hypothetical protein